MKYLYLASGLLLGLAGLAFIVLAMIGALFLTEPQVQATPTTTDTCDRIQRDEQGQLWCMAQMASADENIKVVRSK